MGEIPFLGMRLYWGKDIARENLAVLAARFGEAQMSIGCILYLDRVEELAGGAQKAFFRHAHDLPQPADGALPTVGEAELIVDDPKDTIALVVGERYQVDFTHVPPG